MKCSVCGATGCKLWREYQTVNPRLLCVVHACELKGIDPAVFDAHGTRPRDGLPANFRTDQIGWYVPAVPDGEGNYWGYTSASLEACERWKNLPTFPTS